MNIQAALQTKRDFKRPYNDQWLTVDEHGEIVDTYDGAQAPLRADDILADDWEVRLVDGNEFTEYIDEVTGEIKTNYFLPI
jgi:hypothetical protein